MMTGRLMLYNIFTGNPTLSLSLSQTLIIILLWADYPERFVNLRYTPTKVLGHDPACEVAFS